eukprot:GAFH01001974.1.p1 GENE.GAFH01001974.1~~GAFH01001974.1.p1  ORF type:complete len:188 (+),score=67.12 GAFH01001974.1:238-801(+)
MIAAGLLLMLTSRKEHDFEHAIMKVEWPTIVFFCGLFILVEEVAEMGLLRVIAQALVWVIKQVPDTGRLAVAVVVILWVSGILSAFVDNIPYTAAMLPVIIEIAHDETLHLPLRPLVWSLSLGACLGGIGTLIGASANIVVASMAQRVGHKITFVHFFKIGFPLMLLDLGICTLYVLAVYCWWGLGV